MRLVAPTLVCCWILATSAAPVLAARLPRQVRLNPGSGLAPWIADPPDCTTCNSNPGGVARVCPGDTITVEFTLMLTSTDQWKSTACTIEGLTAVCIDTPDHLTPGVNLVETFAITAPTIPGTYGLTVDAELGQICAPAAGGMIELRDAIVVNSALSPQCSGVANELCNYEEGNEIMQCYVNENQFMEVTRTYNWYGFFPPGTPICVYPAWSWIPVGASVPAESHGIDEVKVTFTWTPTFCQSKPLSQFYSPSYILSHTCNGNDDVFADFYDIHVQNVNRDPSINATPAGPIVVNMGSPVHVDLAASDPDTLECSDSLNKDVLTLAQTQGPGSFVDNGNGDGDFDWLPQMAGFHRPEFLVSDGHSGTQALVVEILVGPIPAISSVGLTLLAASVVCAGALVLRRRQRLHGTDARSR